MGSWEQFRAGDHCPLCEPRTQLGQEALPVVRLRGSSLYLRRDQTYRGHCMLVHDGRHVSRPDQLTSEEWQARSDDLWVATRAIVQTFAPDHLNVESLGNAVPHLHWHLVPRYRHDLRWGRPIWSDELPSPTLLADHDYAPLVSSLATCINQSRR